MHKFKFPKDLKWKPTVDMGFIELEEKATSFASENCTETFQRNYKAAKAKAKTNGVNFKSDLVLVDVCAGPGFESSTASKISPCITRSRPHGVHVQTHLQHRGDW